MMVQVSDLYARIKELENQLKEKTENSKIDFYEAIDRELARLHALRAHTTNTESEDELIYEQMKTIQAALIRTPENKINKFELFCREWAKGCSAADPISENGPLNPWECEGCTRAFLESIYKLTKEK